MNRFREIGNFARTFVNFFNSCSQFICYRLLEIIVFVIVLQVVLRFVFNSPTKWSEEAALICLVWFGMLAAAICIRRNTHVAITYFGDLLPPKGQLVLDLCTQIVTLIFAWILVDNGFQLVELTGVVKLPASQIPKGFLYSSAIAGGILMGINSLYNLFELYLNFRDRNLQDSTK